MSLLAVRADASPSIGAGHVMRCLALAESIEEMGWTTEFATGYATSAAVPALAAGGYCVRSIEGADDPETIIQRDPKAVVVDHYGLSETYERRLLAAGRTVVVFDDLANRRHACDILVDPTPGRAPSDYAANVPAECRLMLGAQHAVLRPVWQKFRHETRRRIADGGSVRRIVVSLGSTDPDDTTSRAIAAIERSGVEADVDVVLGAAAPHRAAVEERLGPRMRLHIDPDDYPEIVASADLVIGAGGSSSFERAILGIPSLMVQTAANQELLMAGFDKAGAAEILSWQQFNNSSLFGERIAGLAADEPRRVVMSQAAARLTDGRGARRLLAALVGEMKLKSGEAIRLRLIEPSDEAWLLEVQKHPNTRRYARNSAVPTFEQHSKWMRNILENAVLLFAVVDAAGAPVGSIRLDRAEGNGGAVRYEVAIAIDPKRYRGGIGSAALALARQVAPGAVLDAFVLPGNVASRCLFLKAGYVPAGPDLLRSLPL